VSPHSEHWRVFLPEPPICRVLASALPDRGLTTPLGSALRIPSRSTGPAIGFTTAASRSERPSMPVTACMSSNQDPLAGIIEFGDHSRPWVDEGAKIQAALDHFSLLAFLQPNLRCSAWTFHVHAWRTCRQREAPSRRLAAATTARKLPRLSKVSSRR
jgi:hypothetical protein